MYLKQLSRTFTAMGPMLVRPQTNFVPEQTSRPIEPI